MSPSSFQNDGDSNQPSAIHRSNAAQPPRLTGGGTASTTWDEATRVLSVTLPQATSLRARVMSVVQQIDLMGIVGWCEQELNGAELDQAIGAIKQNTSWLVSPWHDLELVHAVQHPLVVPNLERLEGYRSGGQTFVHLKGMVPVDPPSTEKVEVRGRWSETVDRTDEPGPRTLTGASSAAVAGEHVAQRRRVGPLQPAG